MAVWGGLTNSCEKKQKRKGKIKHLNAEFQRIARRDKKAFFSDQCKEIEENNRLGKTAAYQAPPSMGFSRQEYWSGVPLPSTR